VWVCIGGGRERRVGRRLADRHATRREEKTSGITRGSMEATRCSLPNLSRPGEVSGSRYSRVELTQRGGRVKRVSRYESMGSCKRPQRTGNGATLRWEEKIAAAWACGLCGLVADCGVEPLKCGRVESARASHAAASRAKVAISGGLFRCSDLRRLSLAVPNEQPSREPGEQPEQTPPKVHSHTLSLLLRSLCCASN
jgi:hypothetical protein